MNLEFSNVLSEMINNYAKNEFSENDVDEKLYKSFYNLVNRNCILVNSYYTALLLTLKYFLGFNQKINNNKYNIIVPKYCSVFLQDVLKKLNINVLFANCDSHTGLISLEDIEKIKTPNTIAIVGYHVFGLPCHVNYLERYCKKNSLKLIYDGGEAFHGKYNNKNLGVFGDVCVFSLDHNSFLSSDSGGVIFSHDVQFIIFLKNVIHGTDLIKNSVNIKFNLFSSLVCLTNLQFMELYKQKSKLIYNFYFRSLQHVVGIQCIYKNELHADINCHVFVIKIEVLSFGINAKSLQTYLMSKKISCPLLYDVFLILPSGANYSIMKAENVVREIMNAKKKK